MTMAARVTPGEPRRALIVEDDPAFRTLVGSAVESFGFDVRCVASVGEAGIQLDDFDPDIAIVDLALGDGPTGLDFARHLQRYYPWVSVLLLTSFRAPELVEGDGAPIDDAVGYLVKSDITEMDVLQEAIEDTLSAHPPRRSPSLGVPLVTRSQAQVLRLLADGLSNADIAQQRGCSVRALERTISRLYEALDLHDSSAANNRIRAVGLYRDGAVDVR